MTSDLIRKSRTLELLKYYERQYDGIGRAIRAFEQMETVDAVEVVHGWWDDSFDGITPYCTACGRSHNCIYRTPNYCPNCGAKMDGGDKE